LAWFEGEPTGTLVAMEPAEFVGMTCYIWFPYAWGYLKKIREGGFVAIRSFAGSEQEVIYVILEMVSVIPKHYALGTSVTETERAFPGFVVEAAKSAKQDWEQKVPEEETTKIKTEAIPTGIQIRFQASNPIIEPDEGLPMVGEEAFLLTDELINKVVNRGLSTADISTMSPCELVLNPNVRVLIDTDQLLRTHFGIFGFTGSGKSNLVSTLIHSLLETGKPIKIVLFDLMSEYLPLLIDELHRLDHSYILSLDMDSIPGGDVTVGYYAETGQSEVDAAQSISRTMLLPRELASHRGLFTSCIQELISRHKLRVLDQGAALPQGPELGHKLLEQLRGNIGASETAIRSWIQARVSSHLQNVTIDQINVLITELDGFIQAGSIPSSPHRTQQTLTSSGTGGGRGGAQVVSLSRTAINVLTSIRDKLAEIIQQTQQRPPEPLRCSHDDLHQLLNTGDQPALLVIQCDRDDQLRIFASELVDRVFRYRRRNGMYEPPTLFVFDEADEFIPGTARESYALSRRAAAILARRGRKFGMGMAISTQRVAYLDTSILAQPHTYWVSKLPRAYDRDTMAKAFGITDDMMKKSLKFSKGQWLLVSYDAIGLENVPVPVHFPNANDRVRMYIQDLRGRSHSVRNQAT
jgi:hypothetical protein